jgi:hypothetical protein
LNFASQIQQWFRADVGSFAEWARQVLVKWVRLGVRWPDRTSSFTELAGIVDRIWRGQPSPARHRLEGAVVRVLAEVGRDGHHLEFRA